ncbi:hypothetical protein MKZ38_008255 [Zalerion maritima]|uniref:Uncharacterized protein n=1 Tax=Zalerion maritima TaxID=339359 RepID=A0AAD5WTE2_9PEZI|nr:hypothetical protein MKZ38_008255 [Zalerion maritima]
MTKLAFDSSPFTATASTYVLALAVMLLAVGILESSIIIVRMPEALATTPLPLPPSFFLFPPPGGDGRELYRSASNNFPKNTRSINFELKYLDCGSQATTFGPGTLRQDFLRSSRWIDGLALLLRLLLAPPLPIPSWVLAPVQDGAKQVSSGPVSSALPIWFHSDPRVQDRRVHASRSFAVALLLKSPRARSAKGWTEAYDEMSSFYASITGSFPSPRPPPKPRKLIRSHVMIGKNNGKSRYRAKRHSPAKEPPLNREGGNSAILLDGNLPWLEDDAVPRRVGTGLSFAKFADDTVELYLIASVLKFRVLNLTMKIRSRGFSLSPSTPPTSTP